MGDDRWMMVGDECMIRGMLMFFYLFLRVPLINHDLHSSVLYYLFLTVPLMNTDLHTQFSVILLITQGTTN